MVGKYGGTLVADGRNMISGTNELAQTMGQKVTELGVRAVIHIVVAPQTKKFTFFIRCQLDMHESR